MIRLLLFLGVIGWIGGFLWFVDNIPKGSPPVADDKIEAIIVLTGGRNRIDYGFELLLENKADHLFISGVSKTTTLKDLLKQQELPMIPRYVRFFSKVVTLGNEATSTLENAHEAKQWVDANNIESFYLVTANYHMQRSLLEFHRLMPDKIIQPAVVVIPEFLYWGWMNNADHALLMVTEYSKFIFKKTQYLITDYLVEAKSLVQ